ncbi:riboflavin biosynthesis protein RibF [Anaeromyxobacter paludicola]|uniref:Riboflavin biosynthesis protein n=1 Tax=Anaeromyxobacter paludicola TaxID=2918171 RepID=A0ABM7XB10_9BACT|nr:riboflavin biosynthesis protein RibF [Anaeromyxobacter paludicola]BDG09048.1 riboflavin biosynthesis protein RibF [Anaeromyxobacter paludicola]
MEVFRSLEEAGALAGCAAAIGNFDGVHVGHVRLFELARARARARGARAVALTFEPHPARVLRPQLAPPLLTPLPRKLELLAQAGLDAAVVQPFDLGYARTSSRDFAARDLAGRLGARDVVVGYDFTAGHDRARVEALGPLLASLGVSLEVVAPVQSDGLTVSSTKIREFLLEGNVEAAGLLLGRDHDVDGVVERGAGRGRGFGFATANLRPQGMLPAHGVYAVRVRLGAEARWWDGVCNVGVKPTVQDQGPLAAETHLFDFPGQDLYGVPLRLAFVARLREERRFPSVEALRARIAEDVRTARALLAAR